MKSPMQRTLEYLRERGFRCEITEHYDVRTRRRHDLLGFADVLAVPEIDGDDSAPVRPVLVQTTTKNHLSERMRKIDSIPLLRTYARAFDIVAHGWGQYSVDGRRKWRLRKGVRNLDGSWEVTVE